MIKINTKELKKLIQNNIRVQMILGCIAIVLLSIIIAVIAYSCSGGDNIVGRWDTETKYDENNEPIAIDPPDDISFTFEPDGSGIEWLPESGETVIMKFTWKTSGDELTITEADGQEHYFNYWVEDDYRLHLTPRGGPTITYIKQ